MKQQHTVRIDEQACIGCGLCQKDCPASNLDVADGKAHVLTQGCIMCGHCVAICPKAAVSMTGFDESPHELDTSSSLDPHALIEALRSRRSIRQFADKPVASDTIAQVIEAGRLTPSGGNAQNVSYVVLKDDLAEAEQIAVRLFRRLIPLVRAVDATAKRTVVDDHFFFKKAPVSIVVVAPDKVDGALAASNMALVAEACGLGVLYSGFFAMAANHSRALRKKLGLGRREKVVATLVLGYPDVRYRRCAQKEAASVRMR